MIVGFDHLALNFKSLESAKEFINKNEFKVLFSQSNIPNHKSKIKLINKFHEQHSLIYCKDKNGFNVELTMYGDNKILILILIRLIQIIQNVNNAINQSRDDLI